MKLFELLEEGPLTSEELSSRQKSKRTLYRDLVQATQKGQVLLYPFRQNNRWTSLWALPRHAQTAAERSGYLPLYNHLEMRIFEAVNELRFKLMRNPDVEEVAVAVSESPDKVRDAVYRIGGKIEWRPPTEEERRKAEEEQKYLLELAALLKAGVVREASVRKNPMFERAKQFLEKYPHLVPEPRYKRYKKLSLQRTEV